MVDLPRTACVEYTIRTALPPDAVLTVRTRGTGQLYDPGLEFKISARGPRTPGHSVVTVRNPKS
jgi:hypothetical protein